MLVLRLGHIGAPSVGACELADGLTEELWSLEIAPMPGFRDDAHRRVCDRAAHAALCPPVQAVVLAIEQEHRAGIGGEHASEVVPRELAVHRRQRLEGLAVGELPLGQLG